MSTRGSEAFDRLSAYRDVQADDAERELQTELTSGERICEPGERAGISPLARAYLFIGATLAACWLLLNGQPMLSAMLDAAKSAHPAPQQSAAIPAPAPPAPTPLAEKPIQEAPAAAALAAAPQLPSSKPVDEVASPEVGTSDVTSVAEEPVAPLPPPRVDPANANQKRALAIGLHPEVSGVLLERMSTADYRNAAYAIKTALATTPEDEVFVWPRQPKTAEAQFEIKFVRGIADDCRRYVVTVTKDRWSTTALPLEKCGLQRIAKRAVKETVESRPPAAPGLTQ